jgi:hypothetical protein
MLEDYAEMHSYAVQSSLQLHRQFPLRSINCIITSMLMSVNSSVQYRFQLKLISGQEQIFILVSSFFFTHPKNARSRVQITEALVVKISPFSTLRTPEYWKDLLSQERHIFRMTALKLFCGELIRCSLQLRLFHSLLYVYNLIQVFKQTF